MKERPIIFSGPMVRAILDGRKTQTRRVVKPQPPMGCVYAMNGAGDKALCMQEGGPLKPWFVPPRPTSADTFVRCPYGQPGDRLWVRETWCHGDFDEEFSPQGARTLYRADYEGDPEWKDVRGWRPSIHMPRHRSRLVLDITSVRVERLQDVRHKDAELEAEGIELPPTQLFPHTNRGSKLTNRFIALWDSLNAARGHGWDANPWVWVVEFRKAA